jgi:hypothetical protein
MQAAALLLSGVGLSLDLVSGKGLGHAYSGYVLCKNFKAKEAAADCTFQEIFLKSSSLLIVAL